MNILHWQEQTISKATMKLVMMFVLALLEHTNGFNIMCYYMNTGPYIQGTGKFTPDKINPHLCTHIYYSCAKPDGLDIGGIKTNEEDMILHIVEVHKRTNPALKLNLVVGCNKNDSILFPPLVETITTMKTFAKNAVTFLRRRKFDGIDINWQYPGFEGNTVNYKIKFTNLLQEIRNAFVNDSESTGLSQLSLTVSLANAKSIIDFAYDMKELTTIVDHMNIMTYDYHYGWESYVGFNAPLYASVAAQGFEETMNVNWTIQYYLSMGANKSMINVGIPSYGRSFTLEKVNVHSMPAPASGPGSAGPHTRIAGLMSFYEICDVLKSGGKKVPVSSQRAIYVVNNDQWIGYDDVNTVTEKTCYAIIHEVAGVAFVSLEYDDFSNSFCEKGMSPLLSTINNVQEQSDIICAEFTTTTSTTTKVITTPTTTMLTTTTTTQPTTTTTTAPPPITIRGPQLNENDFRVFCHISRYGLLRGKMTTFTIAHIDTSLCTHITYAVIVPSTLDFRFEPYSDSVISNLTTLKILSPNIKILVTVEGYGDEAETFSLLIKSMANRKTLARNVAAFLRERKIDGINFHVRIENQHKFSNQLMLAEMFKLFGDEAQQSGLPRLLLVVTASASRERALYAYDIPNLLKYSDFVNVETIMFNGFWSSQAEFDSPLYAVPTDKLSFIHENVDWAMKRYKELSGLPHKLNVAIPVYGNTYKLKNNLQPFLHSPVHAGGGDPAPYTKTKGFMAYNEVCEMIKLGAVSVKVAPYINFYIHKDFLWAGYEDVSSVTLKSCYAKGHGYGGVMIFFMDFDDYLGVSCQQGKYPLLKAVFKVATNQYSCSEYDFGYRSGTCRHAESLHTGIVIIMGAICIWSTLKSSVC